MAVGTGLEIRRTRQALAQAVAAWRAEGLRVGLVPTMGALHRGHLSLVDRLARQVDRVIVSIFVNPAQFGPQEDFDAYPRREAEDMALLAATSAALVYAPPVAEIYPDGHRTLVRVAGLADDLEGRERPGHFEGVATIVLKLLMQSRCDAAIFGEKDYQQLLVIRRMARDLDLPAAILAAPIIREPDGLAASSRNAYLDADQRQIAGRFNVILRDLKARAEAGEALADLERDGTAALLEAGFDRVDYLSFRDAHNLAPVAALTKEARLLSVVRLGRTRLLDNMAVRRP